MRLNGPFAVLPLLFVATCAVASAEKDRVFVESRWYELDDIKAYVKHHSHKDVNWVFPSTRRYMLEGQGVHSTHLPEVELSEQNKQVGSRKGFTQYPDKPMNLSAELDKACMAAFKVTLVYIGGRSAPFGPVNKKLPYEVVGIQSHVMAQAPLDTYHSRKRKIIAQKPPTSNALLCSVYKIPKKNGRVYYETMVVLTARAAYGTGKW